MGLVCAWMCMCLSCWLMYPSHLVTLFNHLNSNSIYNLHVSILNILFISFNFGFSCFGPFFCSCLFSFLFFYSFLPFPIQTTIYLKIKPFTCLCPSNKSFWLSVALVQKVEGFPIANLEIPLSIYRKGKHFVKVFIEFWVNSKDKCLRINQLRFCIRAIRIWRFGGTYTSYSAVLCASCIHPYCNITRIRRQIIHSIYSIFKKKKKWHFINVHRPIHPPETNLHKLTEWTRKKKRFALITYFPCRILTSTK